MGYTLRRSFRARDDLKDIARYTLTQWGEAQLHRYMDQLEGTIRKLTENPETAGCDHSDILPGLRAVTVGQHFVFYRVVKTQVVLVRILHRRRDWVRHVNSPDR